MLAKNIYFNKITKVVFVLLIVALAGLSLAFSSYANNDMQALASDNTGTTHTDAVIDDYSQSVDTGASITLESSDLVVTPAPNDSIATAEATESAVITLDGDLWKAVQSGRITAKLIANGYNKFELLQGETYSKHATYTVSGAMTAQGSLGATDLELENYILADTTLLNADCGNTITITYSSSHIAEDKNDGLGTAFAEAKISGYMSFTLELAFENAIVTIGSTAGGYVQDGQGHIFDASTGEQTLTLGFEDSATFTAIPEDGYYFLGWRRADSSDNISGITLPLGKAVEINSGITHAYSAQFQKIDVSEYESYSYMVDQSQGPVVNSTRYTGVYYLTHSYNGTANDGDTVALASEGADKIVAGPKRAGNYTYECNFFYRVNNGDGTYTKGEKIGGITREFTIDRNAATVVRGSDNAESVTIRLGDNLENLDLTFSATNSADKRSNVGGTLSLYLNDALVDLTKLLPVNKEGVDYTLRFVPNDTNNYSIVDNTLKIIVVDEIKDNGTNLNGSTMTYQISKSIATTVDTSVESNITSLEEGQEVVKVSLRATMDDRSGQYFFIGWRIGLILDGTYVYSYLNSGKVNRDANGDVTSIEGLNYDYYMPYHSDTAYTSAQKEAYKSATFQAVFVKDTTCGTSADTLEILYSGTITNRTPSFSPERAGYQFGYGTMLYYHASDATNGVETIPTAIGEHTLKYTITNTDKKTVVDTRVIKYNITIGEISARINEDYSIYNSETGWAQSMAYTLSVPNLITGGTTQYYYSADGGNTWIAIDSTIAQANGCRTTFQVPVEANTTSVVGYTFMATHDTHGTPMVFGNLGEEQTYKVVAICKDFVVTKIDTITPTFDSLTTTYAGEWTNSAISFDAVVNYGGSGALIDINLVDGDTSIRGWRSVESVGLGLLDGDAQSTFEDIATQFAIDTEYTGTVKFRVRNGVGLLSEFSSEIEVYIDKTSPTIPTPSANKNVNAYGWIGEATTFTYAITDSGNSGIKEVSAINLSKAGEEQAITESNGQYVIVISDSCQYQITVVDNAGNINAVSLQANIDAEELVYQFNEYSYRGAGQWASENSYVIVDITMGASGARLECSVDGGDYIPAQDFSNTQTEIVTQSFSLGYKLPVSDEIKSYEMRIVTRSGKFQEFDLGEVKFDLEAPVYELLTDLSAYQGDVWTSQTLQAIFTVFDNQGAVNSGIDENSVIVDNGGTIVSLGDGKYSLTIDKCTPFTLSIKDIAGNLITREIKANVDTAEPEWTEIKAYIGGGNPADTSVEADGIYEEYDFKDWITAERAEPWVRIEFTIDITSSGTRLEYSNNKGTTWLPLTGVFMPEEGEAEGEAKARTYITAEQNKSYMFRLVTGSNKIAVYETAEELFVRLDFTSPTLRSETFRVGTNANFPLKTTWTNQEATYRIWAQDTTLGSGINYDTLFLYAYNYNVSDENIKNGTVNELEKFALVKSGDYYTYNFNETVQYKYLLKFEDYAGNEYDGDVFIPRVDFTTGFSMTMSGLVYYEGVGNVDLADQTNYWINEGGSVIFKATPYFNAGTTGFGPSGGNMEFSIDGGNTWQTSRNIAQENVEVKFEAGLYTLTINNDQVNTYQFRLITGAGNVYALNTLYNVQKDNTTPEVSASVAYQAGGASYGGEWTKENLRFTINASVGASGATIYAGVGENVDNAEWSAVQTIAPNNQSRNNYYFVVDSSVAGNYFFKVVSGRPDTQAITATGIKVQLDKTAINVVAKAESLSGEEIANGSWVNAQTNIYPNITSIGASGIGAVYYKVNTGAGYGEYTLLPEDNYNVVANANTTSLVGYIFKVVSNSGMEAESVEFTLGYDNIVPSVQIAFAGAKLPESNTYGDWYITDINVQIVVTTGEGVTSLASGYKVFYQHKDNGQADYSEWMQVESNFTLTDETEKGGTDRYYQFKVVTGSGIEVVLEKTTDNTEYYLPIDTNKYDISVDLFVGDIKDTSFAEVSGTGSYSRGDQTIVRIDANDTYSIAKRTTIGGTPSTRDYTVRYDTNITSDEIGFVVGGDDINISVEFFKTLTLDYSNEKQYLQAGDVVDVAFKANEEGFDEFFGAVSTASEGKRVGVNAVYTNVNGEIVARPSAIGTYTLTLTMQQGFEHYHITNNTTTLTVVYFEGEGTSISPYIIRNLVDFYYIDQYMHFEESDATIDSRAYLGTNRREATFKQQADILLDASFTPIGARGDGYTNEFMGTYNGNGYEIIYPNTFVANGDFGVFLNVNGALITNLGVRLNVRAIESLEDNSNIGFVVANAENSGIRSVYAIGNVTLKGNDVKVGGIVGNLKLSLVSYSFADVSITATATSGYIGGVVGYMDGAYTANVYTVSRVTVTNSNSYSQTAPAGTKFVYAGAIAGYAINLDQAGSLPTEANRSYYLDRNIGFDGSIEQGLSLGNRDQFAEYDSLKHQDGNIDFFASKESEGSHATVKIHEITERNYSITVAELVLIKINETKAQANMSGDGTTSSPFLVDSEAKLKYIETFPWAVFKQTTDIMLTEGSTLASTIPFVGVYDGDNHAITGATITTDAIHYGGVFGVVSGTIKNLKVVDIALNYSSNNSAIYAGGVVGVLEEGGKLQNVTVTGTLSVESTNEIIFAGGMAGVVLGGEITDSVAMVSISADGINVVAGNLVAQAQGNSRIYQVVSTSSLSVHYEKRANIGSTIGAVASSDVSVASAYYLAQSTYANDKNIASPVGYNAGITYSDVVFKSYQDMMAVELAGGMVSNIVSGLYPFEGEGSKNNPFLIGSYQELLLVSNYMYASFELTDNIVIGDYNDDGKLDSLDGYDYDYAPVGNGATFTGSLDGNGHSILGLSDSLFEVNAGAVSDITLNLNYKVYASENDIPDSDKVTDSVTNMTYTSAKVAKRDQEILFGALAKVNRATGSLIRVNVSGDIYVRTLGRSNVTLGGIVGVDMGGQIVASQFSAKLSVRASQMVIGGIVGEIKYSDRALSQITMNDVIVANGIDLGGGIAVAGSYIGRIGVETNYELNFASSTNIIYNGNSLGNNQFVGVQINK